MNDTIDVTPEPEVKNPEALLKKNRELLRELAEVKAALQAAQDAHKAAQDAQSKTAGELHAYRITEPLERIARTLSPSPGLMAKTLNDLFDVRLDADNNPALFDKQGQPLTWLKKSKDGYGEEVSVSLEQDSLTQWMLNAFAGNPDSPATLMFKPQGAGALGSTVPQSRKATVPTPATPAAAPAPAFGLR